MGVEQSTMGNQHVGPHQTSNQYVTQFRSTNGSCGNNDMAIPSDGGFNKQRFGTPARSQNGDVGSQNGGRSYQGSPNHNGDVSSQNGGQSYQGSPIRNGDVSSQKGGRSYQGSPNHIVDLDSQTGWRSCQGSPSSNGDGRSRNGGPSQQGSMRAPLATQSSQQPPASSDWTSMLPAAVTAMIPAGFAATLHDVFRGKMPDNNVNIEAKLLAALERQKEDAVAREDYESASYYKWEIDSLLGTPKGKGKGQFAPSESFLKVEEACIKATKDAEARGKGMGKGKGLHHGRGSFAVALRDSFYAGQMSSCRGSFATNAPTAGSFNSHAPSVSYQVDGQGGSLGTRASFATQRSDASFAAGLPQSAARSGPPQAPGKSGPSDLPQAPASAWQSRPGHMPVMTSFAQSTQPGGGYNTRTPSALSFGPSSADGASMIPSERSFGPSSQGGLSTQPPPANFNTRVPQGCAQRTSFSGASGGGFSAQSSSTNAPQATQQTRSSGPGLEMIREFFASTGFGK